MVRRRLACIFAASAVYSVFWFWILHFCCHLISLLGETVCSDVLSFGEVSYDTQKDKNPKLTFSICVRELTRWEKSFTAWSLELLQEVILILLAECSTTMSIKTWRRRRSSALISKKWPAVQTTSSLFVVVVRFSHKKNFLCSFIRERNE